MNYSYYDNYINKNTKRRFDVTPIFENSEVFNNLVDDLIKPFESIDFDKIACIDALGFVIGSAIAFKLKKGLVLIRKEGKLPGVEGTVLKSNEFKDYSNKAKAFEVNKNSISKRDKLLLVDEWIETGTQMRQAIKLIKQLKGEVVGISALAAHKDHKTKDLWDNYNLNSIRDIK